MQLCCYTNPMIALLTGTPILDQNELIMMVGGVGYGIQASSRTLQALSGKTNATLYVHTHVREEALELFGFLSKQDKELFTLLQSVSGVGPRTALAISDRGAAVIIDAVQTADLQAFSSVPRVGKKLAQKIIIELTSKLGSLKELNLTPLNSFERDISDALEALGFAESDIEKALREVELADLSLESAVQKVLKSFGSKQNSASTI
jgi:Holliday junction DNA helicase RuvA